MPLSVRPGMKPFEWAFAVTVTSLLMVAMRKKRKTKKLMYEFTVARTRTYFESNLLLVKKREGVRNYAFPWDASLKCIKAIDNTMIIPLTNIVIL